MRSMRCCTWSLSTMASLFAAPLRNLGYGLQQLQEQREAAEGA